MLLLLFICLSQAVYFGGEGEFTFVCSQSGCKISGVQQTIRRSTVYFALKQNVRGIRKLRNYVLNECSNIDSKNYGKYLSVATIQKMVQPSYKTINEAMEWIENNIFFNDFFDDGKPCELLGDSIRCTTTKNPEIIFHQKTLPSHLFEFVDYPTIRFSKPILFGNRGRTNKRLSKEYVERKRRIIAKQNFRKGGRKFKIGVADFGFVTR